jgi:hypothetical protein
MTTVANTPTRILVMNHGTLPLRAIRVMSFPPGGAFRHGSGCARGHQLCTALRQKGVDRPTAIYRISEMEQALLRLLKKGGSAC